MHKSAKAQIAPHPGMGIQVEEDENIKFIRGGIRQGSDLFQEFFEFNVQSGESVYVGPSPGVERIFSQVIGDNISQIRGRLVVTGGANWLFSNPHGIVFGAEASVDTSGSLFMTTEPLFSVPLTDNPSLSGAPRVIVNIPEGLQDSDPNSAIINQGAHFSVEETLVLLAPILELEGVFEAKNIHLIAENILISDRPDSPTLFRVGETFKMEGNFIEIFLTQHLDSEIIAEDLIEINSTGEMIIAGKIGVTGEEILEDLEDLEDLEATGIAATSAEAIQLINAMLNVFGSSGNITLSSPVVVLTHSEIVAETIAVTADVFEATENSQIIARTFSEKKMDEEGMSEIGIDSSDRVDLRDSRFIVDAPIGKFKLASDRISLRRIEIRSRTRDNRETQITIKGGRLSIHDSAIVAETESKGGARDIHFEIDNEIEIVNSEILGKGKIEVVAPLVRLFDTTIGSPPEEDIPSPPPSMPPMEKIANAIPPSQLPFANVDAIEEPSDDSEFNEVGEPIEQKNSPELSVFNSCVSTNSQGELILQKTEGIPPDPRSHSFDSHAGEPISSQDQEAQVMFTDKNGKIILGRWCVASLLRFNA
ncbi:MAG: filamentous hemagglutinin N-terminal domain-containing protein [Spirulina sp.]